MRTRLWALGLLCLLCGVGAWFLWHHGNRSPAQKQNVAPTVAATRPVPAAPVVASRGIVNTNPAQISLAEWNTNRFAGRLSNTTRAIGQLVGDRHAILLANALIDTSLPLSFAFPKNLQPQGDPGAYIVQARGPIDNAFRAMLAQAGATVIAYIPNDAYLVRASASVAGLLGGNPQTQAVVPYEPYYKIQSPLLPQAVRQMNLPDKTILNLGLFADDAPATTQQIEKLGGQVVGRDQSPFGPIVRVIPPGNWTALATLSGVQIVEPYHPRAVATDLSRSTVGVAADSVTATNYMNLTGSNVLVEVNDTGIDALHPDLTASAQYGRAVGVIGDAPQSLVDTNGHGTHVAGIIAGDGTESTTVTNAPGSTLFNGAGTNFQFRGMAPGATLYSVGGIEGGSDTNIISDQYFQEVPALTNALISNNSWVYEGVSAYDLAAASYDAAVRDALPFVTGSQPVLFVFAAGNAGNGGDDTDFGGGIADSIESPATAKDVITVGALQEQRNITNVVTTITANADGTLSTNTSQPWKLMTSTSYRVAGFSSRGNVGIGLEGTFGRYKPDVVAPGTFIISTRSEQWDIGTYFYQSPTNDQIQTFSDLIVQPGSVFSSPFPSAPTNAVQLVIDVFPNARSPFPFPNLPIYVGLFTSPTVYDFVGANDPLFIPGDPNAPAGYLQQIFNSEGFLGAFNYAVSNNTANPISFDVLTDVITTNSTGDFFLVLSNLNLDIGKPNPASTGPGPYYRYETGTSMATPAVSGTLALMQEFYASAYGTLPSPAMLKAMLVNGARATGFYNYQAQNTINYEGWGLINLPDSLQAGITNQLNVACSTFIQDQNPTNALATGDSQTYFVATTNALPVRVSLAWTDPPGDPAAAIKLVNNLVLVVTNYSNPTNPIVYYGNDFPASSTVNSPHATNTPPTFDSINNVQNVYLPVGAGTNFSVTVMGYRVNVNAVTAQTNNVVQDYALVISCGSGEATNVMTVTATPPSLVSNPTGDQLITYIAGNNQVLLNQFVGANTPLLGTNTIPFTPAAPEGFGPNGWQVTVGMTNQWHFYVITNTSEFSNAAFVTFNPNAPEPDTLSVPRMGVFGGTTENASRDADIDLYVTTDPTITNLNPAAIANCVLGTQVGAPLGPNFAGASLGRGTTEFVVDTNSQSRTPNVYYIGVKSEDQMAAEYGFISIFSQIPFSQMEKGNQVVNGLPLNVNIPDGSPALPGKGYVFGIAIYPMEVGEVTVSNYIWHQNFGDLFGTLTLNGSHPDVLNNHDSFGNPPGPYSLPYDDSVGGAMPGTRPSDGPGNLNNYIGLEGLGVWMLTEVDDSLTQTGMVNNYNLLIQPHRDLTHGINVDVLPNSFLQVGFVDVPPGATNLTVTVTNLTGTANPPLELFVKFGSQPTTNSFDGMAIINNPGLSGPGGSVSLGPPLVSGRYFVGIFNPSPTLQNVDVWAIIGLPFVPAQTIYNSTDTPIPILDDAVTTDSIFVPDNATISGMDVAIAVAHPRISDLVFHLISPDGTRVLLMENRGGTDPNGAGGIATITTNTSLVSTFEGQTATNYTAGQIVGGWTVAGNQVSVVTDPVNAYQGTNLLALANGALSTTLATVPGQTYTLTFAYRGPGIVSWWRGEGNANDSINNHNGTFVSDPRWTNGIVDQAFQFTGNGTPSARVNIPDSTDFILTNALTIEGWAWASNFTSGAQGEFLMRGDDRPGLDPYILFLDHRNQNLYFRIQQNNTLAGTSDITNDISAYLTQWVHLAATWDGNSGLQRLYINGTVVTQTVTSVIPIGALDPTSNPGIGIGNNQWLNYSGPWMGELDEVSLYRRALSPSEVKAIFQNGNAGKFDRNEFAISPSLSLAEAQISLNGVTTNIFGNNTGWQTYTVSFKATGSSTPLQIQGIEPGMLLDAASVVSVQTNYNYLVFTENTNLTTTPIKFAAPPFTFTPAVGFVQWPTSIGGNGHWYKAVTNSTTNPLDWALADQAAQNAGGYLATITSQAENNFVFSLIDSPNFFKGRGGNGAGPAIGGINLISGTVPADWMWVTGEPWGYTSWYAGQPNDSVPTRTIYFSGIQGVPAETWDDFGPTDFNMGGYVIERNSLPLGLFYQPEQSLDTFDGLDALGTWTLEIQDDRVGATNPAPLLLNWQLRFNYVTVGSNIFNPNPLILPALPEQIAIAGQLFTVTNAASGGTMPYTYTLTSTVTNGPIPAIDTNGVITWTPTTNQAPAVYTFTNVVTDANLLTATDIFQVLVVYTNGLPAFPGAGGPGGPAIGGRGGDVYHVINVNDGGPGSLRYGITNTFGSRTIVFDVSGTINLLSDLKINDPYLTIAGQTAPGDGITIQGYTTSVQDTHDVVVRFLRCRPGDLNSPLFQGDSFHFVGVTNSIADHISAAWSIDEALSTTHSTNISVQWSVIAQPLNRSAHYMDSGAPGFQAHGYGSLLRYGSGAVGYYHNLYADNYSRNPRPGDDIQLDFINNVVCNWGIFAGYNEDDSANNPGGYTNFLNYVGNYFIAGSNTTANPNIAFQANVPNAADTQIYQGTNFIDNNASTNLLNGINTGWGMFNGTFTQLAAPTPLPGMPITYTNPPQSYEQVLAFAGDTVAGASAAGTYLLRDSVDTNIVTGVRNKSGRIVDFISSNRFSGVYLITNSEATYTNYTGAGAYWQSQGVSNFVGVNPWPVLASAPQALDSDGDGIPDYWEITLAALGETSMDPALPNNNHLNPDGYTDLEHYINWLAAPHALTVSNTPVDVDLYAIVGRTGNWGFGVTNGTNGTVSLGIDGHTATFMPTNGFFGFASFGFSATNLVTSNQFDVTVSVMVSITNITYSSVVLASAKSASNSATNTVPANSIFYYLVKVPTNALFATNRLLFASGPVNLLFSGVGFPTGTNIGDYTLLPSSTGGSSVLSTTSVPTNIVQGGTYYLGVQNTGGTAVNFGVEVDFTLLSVITNISGPTITQTNINGTNGFLVQWSGPTNYQYTIQWKTNLVPVVPWNSVVNPVINVTYLPPFGHYSWFDDGSLTGGWPAAKFYRVLANFIAAPITNSTPITNVVVSGTIAPLTVSVPAGAIAATNLLFSATGPVDVWFNQTTQPTGDTNAGDVLMLSNVTGGAFVLTGSSVPPLVPGANYYLGVQSLGTSNVAFSFQVNFAYASTNPPSISSITVTNLNGTNAVLLKWVAPTNYQFQVEWATNLAPAIAWHTVPNVVLTWSGVLSPTNAADGIFQYLDDGSQTGGWGPLKFYRLVEYPYATPIPQTLTIINAAIIGNAVRFQWVAPTNYQYAVLWTTNLGLPLASWTILANPVLGLSNGVYTFTDTNQTGPATAPKFFRLLEH